MEVGEVGDFGRGLCQLADVMQVRDVGRSLGQAGDQPICGSVIAQLPDASCRDSTSGSTDRCRSLIVPSQPFTRRGGPE